MRHIHKFEHWSDPFEVATVVFPIIGYQVMQKRVCPGCGLIEERVVRLGRIAKEEQKHGAEQPTPPPPSQPQVGK